MRPRLHKLDSGNGQVTYQCRSLIASSTAPDKARVQLDVVIRLDRQLPFKECSPPCRPSRRLYRRQGSPRSVADQVDLRSKQRSNNQSGQGALDHVLRRSVSIKDRNPLIMEVCGLTLDCLGVRLLSRFRLRWEPDGLSSGWNGNFRWTRR